jgi:glycosyltransferase involved in cell wall biosynthesis
VSTKPLISIVCPFFNEAPGVQAFKVALTEEMQRLVDYEFELICVDDGSTDGTLRALIDASAQDSRFRVIELSRNFGKEAALSAGLDTATGDIIIPMDADLQDPPSLIHDLVKAWEQSGADVVLAKRSDRTTDSAIKRLSAAVFYNTYNRLSDMKIPNNVGDCRLMTRQVVEALKLMPEKQRFMKGLFTWVGFKAITIEYQRQKRVSGKTKFSGWKLWNFALEGITSFSSLPLRVWTYVGVIGALCTFSYGLFIVFRTLTAGTDLPGYASLLVSILFFGSMQLIGLGVLGEYIGRIYMESKRRPTYLIRKTYTAGEVASDPTQKQVNGDQ